MRDFGAGLDLDEIIILDAFYHAADCVLGPFAGRNQLGVAGEDWRPTQLVFFFNQDALSANSAKTVGSRQACRSATDD